MVAGTNGLVGFRRHLRRKGGAPHLSEKADSDEACDVAVGPEAGFPLEKRGELAFEVGRDPVMGIVRTWDSAQVQAPWHHLHKLLTELGYVVPLRPSKVAEIIKADRLFQRR